MAGSRSLARAHSKGYAAAAALLALGLLLALTGCGRAAASATGGRPTVVIGAKQFTEQWIIGEMYKQALTKAGYDVELKSNIGSTEIIDGALTSGQIDLYPEYTGVILQSLARDKSIPHSAHETFEKAKKYQETRGLTMLPPTPFQNKNAVAVKPAFAEKYGLKTIGDLNKAGHVRFAEYPDNIAGAFGYGEMVKKYGLKDTKVRSLNIGLQYKALDHGDVEAADVFTTDPQLARGNYTILKDDRSFYGFQNVAPVVHKKVLKEQGPEFAKTLNSINALLTEKAVQDLNRAVDTVRLTPSEVAEKFLKANHLL
ncbi:glycine betaine ABC transporter substrate-binding protein [Streptomyces iconiensis]|uniref:Glycine betaine ABC transporter substrate-binding protein n=1 Tax=Streptomyces iconiensis TaxID=1384038 RepID=A0ABT7AAA4_9ACTN|nr:glycine betaine ABC transporter substrate-binding protein [Streptomyces iconiensis]MDJ1137533.1 glycine betaine ABC transporter substrate-binding protein [Streptomyces iconiensis]